MRNNGNWPAGKADPRLATFMRANDVFVGAIEAVEQRNDDAARRFAAEAETLFLSCNRKDSADGCRRDIERRIAARDRAYSGT